MIQLEISKIFHIFVFQHLGQQNGDNIPSKLNRSLKTEFYRLRLQEYLHSSMLNIYLRFWGRKIVVKVKKSKKFFYFMVIS